VRWVTRYRLLNVNPCPGGGKRLQVTAELDADVTALLPYLNAVLAFALLHPPTATLSFRCRGYPVVLRGRLVSLGQVADLGVVEEVLDALLAFLNGVAARRDEITPCHHPKEIWQAREIWKHLPRTNCGRCGLPTCTAFLLALLHGQALPEQCEPLAPEARAAVEELLAGLEEGLVL